jgi:chromosome segregation ATPase
MDVLVEERNNLQEKINKATKQNDSCNPLIEQINAWEKITMEKVQLAAQHAREQAIQLLNSKCMKITDEFKSFSAKLTDLKETENYVEHDLSRLKQMIHQFQQDLRKLDQPVTIELNTKVSDGIKWNQVIYVQEKPINAERQQPPPRVIGKFLTSYLNEIFVMIVLQ